MQGLVHRFTHCDPHYNDRRLAQIALDPPARDENSKVRVRYSGETDFFEITVSQIEFKRSLRR